VFVLLVAVAAAAPWTVERLHLGVDLTPTDGDIATAVAIAVEGSTRWVALERETVVGGLAQRQLQLGWSACDPTFTQCSDPTYVDLGLPSAGTPLAPAIAIEPGLVAGAPRVHVLRGNPNPSRCSGASDLEAWVYDVATATTELSVVDAPSGCDSVARSTLRLTETDAWACWTRTGTGSETWCGGRSLAPGAGWATWFESDLASPVELSRFALFGDKPLVASHVPAGADPLVLGWGGAQAGALPTARLQASRPALATAPDGSVHAAWIEKGRRLQYATCSASSDCTDRASWTVEPQLVRYGSGLSTPELAVSEEGRVYLAWGEERPGQGRRVVLKSRCPTGSFSPPNEPGTIVAEPAVSTHDQSLLLGGPHLWTGPHTVHLAWTEHERPTLQPTHGDAYWAWQHIEPCEDPRIATVEALAEAAGWTAQRGSYAFLEPGDCCAPGVTCYGNNPGGSYGYSLVPPSPRPGATPGSGVEVDGAQQYFRLDDDEVVVLLGRTPPGARYFGYRSHIATRHVAGTPTFVLATNGLDTTSWDLQQLSGLDDVSERPLALVTSSDADRASEVHQLLADAGFLPDEIVDDPIGADITLLGVDPADDELATIHRAAVFDDPAAEAAYQAAPGLVPIRLTPTTPRPSLAPHADPGRPVRFSGDDESAWEPSLDALDDALLAAWPGWTVERQDWTRAGASPDPCLADGRPCGDLSSRFFVRTGLFDLPSDGSFAVAIGVNHERSGRATYSSFSTQAWAHNVGLDTVDSTQMPGSAAHLLPGDPLVDDLFVVYVARDCGPFPDGICLEVPLGCPGVAETGLLYGASRLYVDPVTGSAPALTELVGDRVLVFRP